MNRAAQFRIRCYLVLGFGLILMAWGVNMLVLPNLWPAWQPEPFHPHPFRMPVRRPAVLSPGMDQPAFPPDRLVDHGQPRPRVEHIDPLEAEPRERHYYRGMEVLQGPKSIGGTGYGGE